MALAERTQADNRVMLFDMSMIRHSHSNALTNRTKCEEPIYRNSGIMDDALSSMMGNLDDDKDDAYPGWSGMGKWNRNVSFTPSNLAAVVVVVVVVVE